MDITALNSLDRHDAVSVLTECCASTAWIDRMVVARPFRDAPAILTAAEEVWWDLGADDWQEAFAAHEGTSPADPTGEYAEEFGYPYLVFAENLSDTRPRHPLQEASGTRCPCRVECHRHRTGTDNQLPATTAAGPRLSQAGCGMTQIEGRVR
jgi:hypothetical protein